jgi:hypothetical protein
VAGWTPFPELDGVLHELVAGARTALGDDFCGAYLQGSFAVGDADEHSDVDFVVVTHDEMSADQLARLQALHGRLYELPVAWAQHLEGSFFPKERLEKVDPTHAPLPYLDNGARELVWDAHCNTAVVRWSLREHGVVLAGPQPAQLLAPVSADDLRTEARAAVSAYVEWAPEPTKAGPMSRWKQPYLVLTFCRLLHTLERGTVASKRQAGRWALDALDPTWAPLIRSALQDRADPWVRVHQPADPDAIDRTLAFAAYAQAQSNEY